MDSTSMSTKQKGAKRPRNSLKGKENAATHIASAQEGATSGIGALTVGGEEEWPWRMLADSAVPARSPVFTKDGSYFFSVVGSAVRIYSATSGKIVSTLSTSATGSSDSRITSGEGHSDTITAAVLNPENPFQLITASLDGCVKLWDFLDAVLLQTVVVGKPILHMCAHTRHSRSVFIAVSTKIKNGRADDVPEKGNTMIYKVSLSPRNPEDLRPAEMVRIGKTKAAVSMGVSSDGLWLVVIGGDKAYVSSTTSKEPSFSRFVSPERLTCLAFHPSEPYFATGDDIGQIRLWYCLNEQQISASTSNERRAQTVTMHWHAHAVASLAFTPNGAYLLSGGEESVLVIWQLHSGKREYVPRLGAPIATLAIRGPSDGEEEYLVGLMDGSSVFVNASSLSITRSVARVRLDPKGHSRPHHTAVPLACHKASSTLIIPSSHPSSLQVCLPDTTTLVLELEVSPSNRISRRDTQEIENSRVELVAIDPSGSWMATIDRRDNEDEFSSEVFLKVWEWMSKTWVLNTRVDHPHGPKDVVSLTYAPCRGGRDNALLMTAGLDGCIKTWCPRSIKAKEGKSEDFWINRASVSLRSDVPTDACWSADGSLFAVSSPRQVTLYDPESNAQLSSLASPDIRRIDKICFVGAGGRFLIASAKQAVIVWDLISKRVLWHYQSSSEITRILPHPVEDVFTVIAQPYSAEGAVRTSTIIHFKPTSSEPLAVRSLPFRLRAAAWNELDSDCRTLIGITTTWNIVECGEGVRALDEAGSTAQSIHIVASTPNRRNLFQDMFGKAAFDELSAVPPVVPPPGPSMREANGSALLSIFDKPAFMAPPIESVFSSLMDKFLTKAQEAVKETLDDDQEEDAEDMAVDEENDGLRVQQRTVGDDEINAMIEIFKTQSVVLAASKVKENGLTNGVHKGKGTSSLTSSRSSSPIRSSSATLLPPTPAKHAPASKVANQTSPEVSVGKKRKKSTV